jgi:hypothetical protein
MLAKVPVTREIGNQGQGIISVFSLAPVAYGSPNELCAEVKRTEWEWRHDEKENEGFPKRGTIGRRKGQDVTNRLREYEQTRKPCNDGGH